VSLERNFQSKVLRVLDVGSSTGAPVTIASDAGPATAPSGSTITVTQVGSGCRVDVTPATGTPVSLVDSTDCRFDFNWYAWATPGASPTTKIQIDGCSLTDWNAPGGAIARPCQYARGQLHLRQGSGGLHLSAEMLLDDYVGGVSEVPFSWPAEALKAQAVAARSYAEGRRLIRLTLRPDTCWCHVMDTTADQLYVGWGHSGFAPWLDAVSKTAGQILTHPAAPNGVVTAYYSSSTGGATEFGHLRGFSNSPVEWLTSVDDHWSINSQNPNASWVVAKSATSMAATLGVDWLNSVRVVSTLPGSGSAENVEFRGIDNGKAFSMIRPATWVRSTFGLKSNYFRVNFRAPGDEMLFYRATTGAFRYYDTLPNGALGSTILSGSGYSKGWSSISGVDLDGDGQDEIFFYRAKDGAFRYYDIRPTGQLGSTILSGSGYSKGWSSISAVDLDGDGRDEMFFYRATDGAFRYYRIRPDGQLQSLILGGNGYSKGWDSITAVDLDGDGQDEMMFYRSTDGAFRYYNITKSAGLVPILSGSGYTKNWDVITAVDLDGDGQDELHFYKSNGTYRYYDVRPNGQIGSPLLSGTGYSSGWSTITAVDLDGS
jgi:SpoIID/LytB domain protein